MRIGRYLGGVVAAAVVAFGLAVEPAHATVHEIVAQWCSGHEELGPPGISDPSKNNFARGPASSNSIPGSAPTSMCSGIRISSLVV